MWKALIRLVEKWGCHHQWDTFRETSIYKDGDTDSTPIRIELTMICEECGKIKKIEV